MNPEQATIERASAGSAMKKLESPARSSPVYSCGPCSPFPSVLVWAELRAENMFSRVFADRGCIIAVVPLDVVVIPGLARQHLDRVLTLAACGHGAHRYLMLAILDGGRVPFALPYGCFADARHRAWRGTIDVAHRPHHRIAAVENFGADLDSAAHQLIGSRRIDDERAIGRRGD